MLNFYHLADLGLWKHLCLLEHPSVLNSLFLLRCHCLDRFQLLAGCYDFEIYAAQISLKNSTWNSMNATVYVTVLFPGT